MSIREGEKTLPTALCLGVGVRNLEWEEVAISSCRREGKEDTYYCLVSWCVGEVFGMGGMRWSIVSFRLDFIFSREVSLFKPWVAVKRTR